MQIDYHEITVCFLLFLLPLFLMRRRGKLDSLGLGIQSRLPIAGQK